MNDFILHNPTKIIFGKTAMQKIAEHLKPYGAKVLLTYGGGSIKKNGIYEKIIQQLAGFTVQEFSGIEPNPRIETLRKGIEIARAFQPDIILAVGGGSVIDGSKLIAAATYYNGDAWDIVTNPDLNPSKYIPLATVLTLAATGSEMNRGAVISKWETHEKPAFGRNELYPVFSICDPQNLYSVPKDQTAYGIVDAYSHVLEQYINTTLDAPIQDRFSEGILLTLIENALTAIQEPTNYTARANVMFSATMALNNLIGVGVNQDWATHQIEHEFSAFYDIPHGAGLAIITPRWMEVVKDYKTAKFIQYGKRVWGISGDDEDIIANAIQKTYDFFASLGIKMSLKEWGIDNAHFPEMIQRLAGKAGKEKPLTAHEIQTILNNCL